MKKTAAFLVGARDAMEKRAYGVRDFADTYKWDGFREAAGEAFEAGSERFVKSKAGRTIGRGFDWATKTPGREKALKIGIVAAPATALALLGAYAYNQNRKEKTKLAYGVNNSVGPTGPRDGAQTSGEQASEEGATGIGKSNYGKKRTNTHVTRGPGNQGSRGVPEWLRFQKYLPSPKTQTGSDKTPRPNEEQS